MKFHSTELKGVFLVEYSPYRDDRGELMRHFCLDEYEKYSLNNKISQTNISSNKNQYTLRGFHYQEPPHQECKTLFPVKGSIYNIVLDL